MKRIGFFLRLLAAIIDTIFGAVLCVAVIVSCTTLGLFTSPSQPAVDLAQMFLVVAYTLPEVFLAGTPGKLLLRMRICRASGQPADRWMLLLRWSTKQSPLIFQILYVMTDSPGFRLIGGFSGLVIFIGCLYALNDDKRAWHDQWAGTAVYKMAPKQARGFPVLVSQEK